jgi:hypothetical protein
VLTNEWLPFVRSPAVDGRNDRQVTVVEGAIGHVDNLDATVRHALDGP